MIDLAMWAPDRATLSNFGANHPPNKPLLENSDPDDPTRLTLRPGLSWSFWAGSGKLMRTVGTYNADGTVATEPTYFPGVVLLLRVHPELFYTEDQIDQQAEPPNPGEETESWSKSKFARYIKNNGTAGTAQGIDYYELDGVRLFKYQALLDKVEEWGVPSHQWAGGNAF